MNEMSERMVRVNAFLPLTEANGPGRRAGIWVQGCTLACDGCYNPATHSPNAGQFLRIAEITEWVSVAADCLNLRGVTISGGEPLQQPDAVFELIRAVRLSRPKLDALLFTGFAWDEIERMGIGGDVSRTFDAAICGRFERSLRLAQRLRGSSNKTLHIFSDKFTPAEFEDVPEIEIVIGKDGRIEKTGIGFDSTAGGADVGI